MVSAFELSSAVGMTTERGEVLVTRQGKEIEQSSQAITHKKISSRRRKKKTSVPVPKPSPFEQAAIEGGSIGGGMTTQTGEEVIVIQEVPSRQEVYNKVQAVKTNEEKRISALTTGSVQPYEETRLKEGFGEFKQAFLGGVGLKTTDTTGTLISERVRTGQESLLYNIGFAAGSGAYVATQVLRVKAPVKIIRGAETAFRTTNIGAKILKTGVGTTAAFATEGALITAGSTVTTKTLGGVSASSSDIKQEDFKTIVRAGYEGRTGRFWERKERRGSFEEAAVSEARALGYSGEASREAISSYYSISNKKLVYDAVLLGSVSEGLGRETIALATSGKVVTGSGALKKIVRPRLFAAGVVEGSGTYIMERASKFEKAPVLPKFSYTKGSGIKGFGLDPGVVGSGVLGGASAVIIGTPIATAGIARKPVKGAFYGALGYGLDPTELPGDITRDIIGTPSNRVPVITAVPDRITPIKAVVETPGFNSGSRPFKPVSSKTIIYRRGGDEGFSVGPGVSTPTTPTTPTPSPISIPSRVRTWSVSGGRSNVPVFPPTTPKTPLPTPIPVSPIIPVTSDTPSQVPPIATTVPTTTTTSALTNTFITSRSNIPVTTFNIKFPPIIPIKKGGGGFGFSRGYKTGFSKGYTPSASAILLSIRGKASKSYRTGISIRPIVKGY